jgi:hypothetical protein
MVAAVERTDRDHLHDHAGDQCGDQPKPEAHQKAVGQADEGRGEIGAQHVERAVREVDQIHDAEDQRQPGRQQKQQHAELNAVQALFDQVEHSKSLTLSPDSPPILRDATLHAAPQDEAGTRSIPLQPQLPTSS